MSGICCCWGSNNSQGYSDIPDGPPQTPVGQGVNPENKTPATGGSGATGSPASAYGDHVAVGGSGTPVGTPEGGGGGVQRSLLQDMQKKA